MKKESILFAVIGLLLGLIVGFMGANKLNGRVASGPSSISLNSNIPAGHPEIGGKGGPSMQQIQDIVGKAKQDPSDFNAQVEAAGVYAQIGRYPDAVNFLRQANQLKPDDLNTIVSLANALFDAGNFSEAAAWYEKALAKRDDPNFRTDYGLTFMLREPADVDRAISEFRKVLKATPGHVQALQNIAAAYVKKKDASNATAAIAELEKSSPQNEAIASLKGELEKLGSN